MPGFTIITSPETEIEGADPRGAYLGGANLIGAHLEETNLKGTNLEGACLKMAHLGETDLKGAYLKGADLKRTYLKGAKNLSIEQLSKVKTPYDTKLDEKLLIQLKKKYTVLFEEPNE